jgi:SAM-dependent methyltransferase
MSDVKSCYLCSGTDHRRRPGRVRDDAGLQILECRDCGLVFLSKLNVSDRFYEQSGMHKGEPPPIAARLRDTERDDERRFRDLSALITNRDVLDFGCGTGGFLMKARALARSVTGVELEAALEPHYRANQLTVARDFADLPPGAAFDIVTAFHVIEHLEDPAAMLRRMAARLRGSSGRIVIEVPSASDALLTLYESGPFSEFTYWSCHLYLFSAANLPRLAGKAGLKLEYVRHVQRYPLSNHLHWLARGKPGGHQVWSFLDDEVLSRAYEARLASLGITDTVIASLVPAINE